MYSLIFYNLLNVNVGVRGHRKFDRGRQTPGKGPIRVSQPQHVFIGLLDWIIPFAVVAQLRHYGCLTTSLPSMH